MAVKFAAGATLILSLFLVSLAATALDFLYHVSDAQPWLIDGLTVGRAHLIFLAPEYWEAFPSLPSFWLTYEPWAFWQVVPPACALGFLLGYGLGFRPLFIGPVCLAFGAVPYVEGTIALWGNTDPSVVGPWVAAMLCGPLYALLICAACCVAELAWRRKVDPRAAPR